MQSDTYTSLEEIQRRRNELSEDIDQHEEIIADMWHEMFRKRDDSTKGEYISALIANSITAIDAFLLVRKLIKNYGSLFGKSSKKSKKKH